MEVKTKGKDPNSGSNDKGELKLGGNIILVGFSLEPAEMIVAKKIIGNYAKKIGEQIEYQDIKIKLKQTQKAQSFLHEVQADVRAGGDILAANAIENNLYTALSEALEKVYNQAEHHHRTSRQGGKNAEKKES